jgi:excisionase family DNA binding protein
MAKYFTTKQVAAKIGISRQTLYSWIDAGLVDAPKPLVLGGASVRLWTQGDIDQAAKAKGKLKPGPKRKKEGGR